MNSSGFNLIEILIALAIISILAMVSYPLYIQHVRSAQRAVAKTALLNLAAKLEHYHVLHNSYEHASLNALGIPEYTHDHSYRLSIAALGKNTFVVNAMPVNQELNCGTLSINQQGVKKISGIGSVKECW